jgi:hypothetical protein
MFIKLQFAIQLSLTLQNRNCNVWCGFVEHDQYPLSFMQDLFLQFKKLHSADSKT